MKHLFQGEERGFWGKEKNKFFRMVLLFSVHSPDPFFPLLISLILICLTQFLSFYPQCFRISCIFSLCVSSSKLSEVLSVITYIFTAFFVFCHLFKAWILLQKDHGTHYCAWRGDSKNRHIWNEVCGEAVWWLRSHILETSVLGFERTHCCLLAMTRPVYSFPTLSLTSSRSSKELIISSSPDCWGLLR